ncbi:hypothetical protein MiAbW_00223 [Microcystis aeruginosa NIES-4325]|uniref:Uncharacterized protein n=1 Tax=Microcystis aeruginosa NIES-4325 TaxID=2569534 RepID=A0A5J4F2N3_MICAE|nr:hypothetical protein MiAbW_00223 [Microcystis aeruginosa NIES-4325]
MSVRNLEIGYKCAVFKLSMGILVQMIGLTLSISGAPFSGAVLRINLDITIL